MSSARAWLFRVRFGAGAHGARQAICNFNTRIALNASLLYVDSFQIKMRKTRVFVCSDSTIHRRM
eukprot:COSAG02_NODE_53608_length_300_cov_2.228856_1_plen_64_part_10